MKIWKTRCSTGPAFGPRPHRLSLAQRHKRPGRPGQQGVTVRLRSPRLMPLPRYDHRWWPSRPGSSRWGGGLSTAVGRDEVAQQFSSMAAALRWPSAAADTSCSSELEGGRRGGVRFKYRRRCRWSSPRWGVGEMVTVAPIPHEPSGAPATGLDKWQRGRRRVARDSVE
jgi:hypothetical protein